MIPNPYRIGTINSAENSILHQEVISLIGITSWRQISIILLLFVK